MNILILSKSEYIYSTQRITREARNRGHLVKVIDHSKCEILLTSEGMNVFFESKNILDKVDFVIPRIGYSLGIHGTTIINVIESKNIPCLNPSLGIIMAQDKIKSLQHLSAAKIPIPKTLISINTESVSEQLDYFEDYPIIIKSNQGTQGLGVMIAESKKSAQSIIDAFLGMNSKILLQEFIKESSGEDIRVFIVGDQVITSMKRIGQKGDFRSNIHRGGLGKKIKLTEEEKQIAIKAAQVFKLKVAGVDLMKTKSGVVVLEINSSPGLQGIESVTEINIANKIIKQLEIEHRKNL